MALDPISANDPSVVAGGIATVDPNQLTPVIAVPRQQQQQPGQAQPVQQVQPPPKPVPIAYSLVRGLINPQSQTQALGLSRPASRTDVIENFIAQFATALSSGLSQAHGPNAAYRGAAAAIGAPYGMALQQYQMGQAAAANQAEIQQRQAQTALTQAQAQPVNIPGIGTLPAGSVPPIYRAQIAAEGGVQKQLAANQGALAKQDLANQGKIAVANITNPSLPLDPMIANAVGRPELANQVVGKALFDSLIKDFNARTKVVGTTRTGVQIREDADGNLISIPVSSTTRANLPMSGAATPIPSGGATGQLAGGSASAGGNAPPKPPGRATTIIQSKIPSLVFGTDASGRQVAGTPSELRAAGVQNAAKLPANMQQQVATARNLIQNGGLLPPRSRHLSLRLHATISGNERF